MKNLLVIVLCFASIETYAQTRCDLMVQRGDTLFTKDKNITDALKNYLDAITCNRRLRAEIEPKINAIYDRLAQQRDSLQKLDDKNRQLLAFFFTPSSNTRAWAQGKNGKYAVINRNAQVLGPGDSREDRFIWEEPQPFEKDIAIAKRGGEYFFVNNRGEAVDGEGYEFVHPTTANHYFSVQRTLGAPIEPVISAEGNHLERIRMLRKGFDKASEDYFPVKTGEKKWGLMRYDGTIMGTMEFDSVTKVYEGYARVKKGNKWGFIDTTGNIPSWGDIKYDQVGDFKDSLVWMKKGGTFSLIERDVYKPITGNSLLQAYDRYFETKIPQDTWVPEFANATFRTDNGNPTNIDPTSEGFGIEEVQGQIRNISLYQQTHKFYVNYNGQRLSEAYDSLKLVGTFGEPEEHVYQTTQRAQKGLLVFNESTNPNAPKRQLSTDYQEIKAEDYLVGQNYVRVKKAGKWGYVFWGKNSKGAEILRTIPCKYDIATRFHDRFGDGKMVARVFIQDLNLYFYINMEGKMLATIERNKIW